jgi:Fic family protein
MFSMSRSFERRDQKDIQKPSGRWIEGQEYGASRAQERMHRRVELTRGEKQALRICGQDDRQRWSRHMSSLFALDTLSQRLEAYVAAKGFAHGASGILKEVLTHGEMVRGEAKRVTGMKDRTARKVLAALVEDGILESDTAKGPVHLKFDAASAEQLFPNLFPASA